MLVSKVIFQTVKPAAYGRFVGPAPPPQPWASPSPRNGNSTGNRKGSASWAVLSGCRPQGTGQQQRNAKQSGQQYPGRDEQSAYGMKLK